MTAEYKWSAETVRRGIENFIIPYIEKFFREEGSQPSVAAVFATRNPNDGTPLDNMFWVPIEMPDAGDDAETEGKKKNAEAARVRELASLAEAVAVVMIGEAWTCVDDGSGTPPVNSPNRRRMIWLAARSLWGAWDWLSFAGDDGAVSQWERHEDQSGDFDRWRHMMPEPKHPATMVRLAREALHKVRWAVHSHIGEMRERWPEGIMYEGSVNGWTFNVGKSSPMDRARGAGRHHVLGTVMTLPPELAADAFRLAVEQVSRDPRA